MRLTAVIDSLGSGGAQRQIVYLTKELKRLGHQIDIFVCYSGFGFYNQEIQSDDIDIIGSGNLDDGLGVSFLYSEQLFNDGTEDLDVDVTPRTEVVSVVEPPAREAGVRVGSAEELVEKLKNEAKVI